ncbi:MAG: BTAD domain-containing putative transcriptional regulator [Chloroflexia bacterium]
MPRTRAGTAPPDHSPALQIGLLDGFTVAIDGQPLPDRAWGGSRKARALAKLLALTPGQRLHRDQALDALWPDLDPEAAGRALHQALYLVRRALAPAQAHVALQGQVVALHAPGGLTTDLATFQAAADRARRSRAPADYRAALAHYAGDLLPDDRYEEWAVQPREAARTTFLGLLRDLAAAQEAGGDAAGAVATCERLVAAEPADEAAHVALMRLHAQGGQRARALQQFGQLRAALQREIDAEPEPASQQLYAAILAGQVPAVGSRQSAVGSAGEGTKARHNLPAPTTTILGREVAIAAIRAELAGARLVTLLGAGGIGKTRLALAVGHALLAEFPGGVWLLDLAALQDGALLDGTLARVLGVRERTERPLRDAVIAALGSQPTLIVLDNCEHLIADCADLAAALLAGCPDLRVLATSREALRVAGELVWRVPTLPVPELPEQGAATTDLAALAENPAVRLFVERARFARPDFALTTEHAEPIAAICRRLDGIPLAIELAAVRVAVLTPRQLAARLDDALRVLTGGPRTAPARQQTLRATLDWSHALLAPDEQALLARLAIFAGGWSLAAAEEVGSGKLEVGNDLSHAVDSQDRHNLPVAPFPTSHFPLPTSSVLDTLAALVDKSLVQVEQGTEATEVRYRLLEPIRQYAAEQLAALGVTENVQDRHAAYFLARADAVQPLLFGSRQDHWLNVLAHDQENFRAALRQLAGRGRWLDYARLAVALYRFWYTRGQHTEGRGWLAPALRAAAAAEPDSPLYRFRPRVMLALGNLCWPSGDVAAAEELYREILTLGDERITPFIESHTKSGLGLVALIRGEHATGRAHFEEALRIARQIGDRWLTGVLLNNLGLLVMWQGDVDAARVYQEENLALCREEDDTTGIASALVNLCEIAYDQGDDRAVIAYATEALERFTATGDRRGMAVAHNNLAVCLGHGGTLEAARRNGEAALEHYTAVHFPAGIALSLSILGFIAQQDADFAAARRYYRDCLTRRRDLGNGRDLALSLEQIATLAADLGEMRRAVAYIGAASRIRRREQQLRRTERDRALSEPVLAGARVTLGAATFAAAEAEGEAWTSDEAVAHALAYLAD